MGKVTNLFKVVAVLFIAMSLGGTVVANAQGGGSTSSSFTGSCATSTYAAVNNDSPIFYAPEQFSTVSNVFLRAGTSFLVCTDIAMAGWTAFKITPQSQILFVPTGTFAGFRSQGTFGNQTVVNNQANNQLANNGGSQQGGLANQTTAGGISGTTQNGVANQGTTNNGQNAANNGQSGFGNTTNNGQNTANNGQSGFGNTTNNSQGGFGNQNNLNNRGVGQNNNLGSPVGVNRTLPIGTIGVCANTSNYFMVMQDAEISYAPQANSGTGQFLRPGSVFTVCGDSNIQGWIAFKITPQSAVYFVPAGTFR